MINEETTDWANKPSWYWSQNFANSGIGGFAFKVNEPDNRTALIVSSQASSHLISATASTTATSESVSYTHLRAHET